MAVVRLSEEDRISENFRLILLVIFDAARAKNFHLYGYGKRTSNYLERLCNKYGAIIFERCFSCTNTTDSSLTTILSGLYPRSHGIKHHGEAISNEDLINVKCFKTLPYFLKELGFRTIAVDWLGRWHRLYFDIYSSTHRSIVKKVAETVLPKNLRDKTVRLVNVMKRVLSKIYASASPLSFEPASVVTENAIKLLDKNLRKYSKVFMLIHYWDTHLPYNAPEDIVSEFYRYKYETPIEDFNDLKQYIKNKEWLTVLTKILKKYYNDIPDVVRAYDASIAYVDKSFYEIIEFLENNYPEYLFNSIIIVTADHGESLTEHGIFFDHHGLYENSIHVPLVFFIPGKSKYKIAYKEKGIVQHVDLLPSILQLISPRFYSIFSELFDGYSFADILEKRLKWGCYRSCVRRENYEEGGIQRKRNYAFIEEWYVQRRVSIRTERFKLIFHPSVGESSSHTGLLCRYCGVVHGSKVELYDLYVDLNETQNLLEIVGKEEYREIAKTLQSIAEFTKSVSNGKHRKLCRLILSKKLKILRGTMSNR